MGTQRLPDLKIELNGINITSSIKKFIHSVSIEDVFDTKFTVSRLSLRINSKYTGKFYYRDQIRVFFWWTTTPTEIFTTNIFYVDFIDDLKQNNGQTYTINALEADLTLGFKYGEEVVLENKTLKGALNQFKEAFTTKDSNGNIISTINITENCTSNVYIGSIPIPDNYQLDTVLPNNLTVTKKFNSWSAVLQHICEFYGYFGNLDGRNFKIERIESRQSFESDFILPDFDSIFDLSYENKYTNFYKRYTAFFANSTRVLDFIDKFNSFNIGAKDLQVLDEDAYFNRESANERLNGIIYNTYLESFRIKIKTTGFPAYKAGRIFYLGESYGQYGEMYRCTKVTHTMDDAGWISDIEGFPLNKIIDISTEFKSENLGTIIIIPDFSYSQIISSVNPTTLTGTNLDNFAKSLNPSYTLNIGNLFISEGQTEGIRADISFCLALIETKNFTIATTISNRNPGNLSNSAGTSQASFSTWQLGIRAEIQHLFGFAIPQSGIGSRNLVNAVVDPRWTNLTGLRGSAKKVLELSGKWNASSTYGQAILDKLKALYIFLGFNNPTLLP